MLRAAELADDFVLTHRMFEYERNVAKVETAVRTE